MNASLTAPHREGHLHGHVHHGDLAAPVHGAVSLGLAGTAGCEQRNDNQPSDYENDAAYATGPADAVQSADMQREEASSQQVLGCSTESLHTSRPTTAAHVSLHLSERGDKRKCLPAIAGCERALSRLDDPVLSSL